jgi:hypothetical protein
MDHFEFLREIFHILRSIRDFPVIVLQRALVNKLFS